MKIEIGSGDRPTIGFYSSDINGDKNVDFRGNPWELELEDGAVERFLALGVMEHLKYSEFRKTLNFVNEKLKVGGRFYFDVPDLLVWCDYYIKYHKGENVPFSLEHIQSTLYGWQRWEGDEHKSGWSERALYEELNKYKWSKIEKGVELFLSEGYERRRMTRLGDAHLYICLTK